MFKTLVPLAVLGLLSTSAGAIDYVVTRTDDPNPSVIAFPGCRPSGGCSLRQAILASNQRAGADRIVLARASYTLTRTTAGTEVDGESGPLWVTDALEIVGGGSTRTRIEWASGLHHAHSVLVHGVKTNVPSSPLLQLRDLTIAHGRGQSGGCLLTRGVELHLYGVLVEDCQAYAGGALYSSAPLLVLSESTLQNNLANDKGGGIYLARSVTVIATDATLRNNRALGDGGAVYAAGMFGIVNFNTDVIWRNELGSTQFLDNSAGGHGGAVALGLRSSLNLFRTAGTPRTRFEGNIAALNGGAISMVSLSPSQLSKLTLDGALLANNAAAEGGAIAARGQSLIISSEFLANSAQSGAGGAIYLDGASNNLLGSNEIRKSSFNTNSASGNGGAIASVCQPLSLRDSSIWANTSPVGNAIHASGQTSLVHVSTRNHGSQALVKAYHTACANQSFSIANSLIAWQDRCVAVSGSFSSGGGNFYSASAPGCNFIAGLDFSHSPAALAVNPGTFGGEQTVLGWDNDGLTRPQVNAGQPAYCSSQDVRGLPRSGACDAGAFEQQTP